MRVVSQHGRGVGEQGVDVALGPHAQQVDIEIRYRLAGFGVGRQQLFVGQRRGGEIGAEFAVAGRPSGARGSTGCRCDRAMPPGPACRCARRRPRGRSARRPRTDAPSTSRSRWPGRQILQQPDAVAAAGQHDQRSPAGRHGGMDGVDQSAAPAASTRASLSGKISTMVLTRTAPSRCLRALRSRSHRHPAAAGLRPGTRGFPCAPTEPAPPAWPVRLSVAVVPSCGRLRSMVSLLRTSSTLSSPTARRTGPVDAAGQPARQDVEGGFGLQPGHQRRLDRLVGRLVDRGGEQRPPVGDTGPGQIGIAGGVSGQPALDRRQRVGRRWSRR